MTERMYTHEEVVVGGQLLEDMLTAVIPSTVVRAAARGAVGVIVSAAAVFAWCRERAR